MNAALARRRDFRVISIIGTAHGLSHFYQLALPPLFPLLHRIEGIEYTKLGLLTALMYVASAVCQPPAGFMVDRFGARRVLMAGGTVMAAATTLYGLASSYDVMMVAAVLAGVGNSVFHPCDYSVLSATVSEERVGRAFGFHIFGGYIGYGLAPILMAALGPAFGWQTAIIAAGLAGFLLLAVIALGSGDFRDSSHDKGTGPAPAQGLGQTIGALFRPQVLLCWLFFGFVAMGQIGLQTKSPAILSLPAAFGLDVETAGLLVSVMLFGVPVGVLLGGHLADRMSRPNLIITVAYTSAAVLMLLMWRAPLGAEVIAAIYLITGVAYGVAFPSRDMLVRQAAPRGSSGKVFGFVYSGMDVGSLITPVLFGWFIDEGFPRAAFLCIAALWFGSIFLIMGTSLASTRSRPAEAG